MLSLNLRTTNPLFWRELGKTLHYPGLLKIRELLQNVIANIRRNAKWTKGLFLAIFVVIEGFVVRRNSDEECRLAITAYVICDVNILTEP
ncbi:hypothetical protein E2320_011102 [Naja naja]|nr:hypothetical protein E2320_011102 [Naja naja]